MTGTNGASHTGNGSTGTGTGHWGNSTNPNLGGDPREKLESFTFEGRYYTRTGTGLFVDLDGQTIDLDKLFPPLPDDTGNPWVHSVEAPAYVDWVGLDGTPIPPQEWIVPGWLPRLETTGFGAGGGEGKTLLMQMLATAGAIGHDWLKINLPMFKSFLVLCEDRQNDIRRRQAKINQHYECCEAELAANMRVWPRRNSSNNYLMLFDRDAIGHRSSFFDQLVAEIKAFRADLVVLDTKSDVFFGNQNDEQPPRTFVRTCTDKLAEATDAAVVLVYHPSRAGMRDGSGMSGSVQWDGAFRARWLLETPDPEDNTTPHAGEIVDDVRVLTRKKSNYSRRNETIDMKWDDGVLVRTDQPAPGGIMANFKMQKADRVFRQLVEENRTLNGNQPLSNVNNSPRYAPKVFAAHPHSEKVSYKEFEAAMRRALTPEGGFEMVEYSRAGHPAYRIAKVAKNTP